jgi:tetratricopeptide (TPR) repeat protein
MDKRKQAETSFKKAIAFVEKRLGAKAALLAPVLGNLAVLYQQQKRWSVAEPILVRALEIAEGSFGMEHPETAIILSNLGQSYYWQGKVDDAAKAKYADSLQVQEQSLGPKAPEVATTLEQFAKLLHRMNNEQEALVMETRANSIRAELQYTVKAKPNPRP